MDRRDKVEETFLEDKRVFAPSVPNLNYQLTPIDDLSMPPRKTRASKKAEAAKTDDVAEQQQSVEEPAASSSPKGKGKAKQTEAAEAEEADQEASTQAATTSPRAGAEEEFSSDTAAASSRLTMEQRREKMAALKKKMSANTAANRKDLKLDKQPRSTPRDASNSHKLAKAERTLDQRDAEERGEDWERLKNWKYTIEDGEKWEAMLDEKEERLDKGIIDFNGLAARSYQRTLRGLKPDLKGYQRAEGSNQGSSNALVRRDEGSSSSSQAVVRKEDVYSNLNTLSYGNHKANDQAIDRVISHINAEAVNREKRSRKRPTDDEGEVTYINEKNAVFNRKLGRAYDEYTKDIRDNFERGTA